ARGNPILGKANRNDAPDTLATDANGLPYTTLGYANGPGYAGAEGRPDLSDVDTTDPDYRQEAVVPLRGESHGGDDVGVWARGPGADAVRGSIEQNTIFHLLLQASPRLRGALCERGYCEQGIPVELPDPAVFR
ncbi:MAG TPA: alkaline phosphatase, partial [Luteimonas sp.]|nr:alkaline phosphatase [Luteimonas sp.]